MSFQGHEAIVTISGLVTLMQLVVSSESDSNRVGQPEFAHCANWKNRTQKWTTPKPLCLSNKYLYLSSINQKQAILTIIHDYKWENTIQLGTAPTGILKHFRTWWTNPQCRPMWLRFLKLISMWLNKDHCRSLPIIANQIIHMQTSGRAMIGIEHYWGLIQFERQRSVLIFNEPHFGSIPWIWWHTEPHWSTMGIDPSCPDWLVVRTPWLGDIYLFVPIL